MKHYTIGAAFFPIDRHVQDCKDFYSQWRIFTDEGSELTKQSGYRRFLIRVIENPLAQIYN